MCRTIRAASCAGASARSGASSTSPAGGGSRRAGDTVRLDLADCFVDAIEIARAAQEGIETLAPERLRTLSALFTGDFLDGLEIDRNPAFNGWLTAQRRRFRGCHAALLEHLAASAPATRCSGYLEKWLELAPFDQRVHEMLLTALARRGRIREGEEHLAATARLFEAEGLDCCAICAKHGGRPERRPKRAPRVADRNRPLRRPRRGSSADDRRGRAPAAPPSR